MAAWLFSWISSLNTDVLTEWFIWIMLILFFAAIIRIFLPFFPSFLLSFAEATPNLLTTLGILGTFLGIAIGLVHFDVSDIDGSIPKLLEGLQVAFLTSIVDIVLSIVLKIFFSFFKEKVIEQKEVQANDPNAIFELLKQQKALLEQLRDQHQLQRGEAQDFYRVIQPAVQGGFQGMQKELHDFAEKVSKNNSEQLIQALKEVIGDFNAKINEQFGENFKQLNQGVEKLVTWQENYKNHLIFLHKKFKEDADAIASIKESVAQISKESQAIPQAMQQLQNIMQGLNQQLENSEAYLKSFAALTDQAEQMLPTLHAHLNAMQERLAEALKLFEDTLKIRLRTSIMN